MKKIALSLALSLAGSAVAAGITYAVKRNGGLKRTVDQLKQTPLVAGAIDKMGDLKQRFAANDTADHAAAA